MLTRVARHGSSVVGIRARLPAFFAPAAGLPAPVVRIAAAFPAFLASFLGHVVLP